VLYIIFEYNIGNSESVSRLITLVWTQLKFMNTSSEIYLIERKIYQLICTAYANINAIIKLHTKKIMIIIYYTKYSNIIEYLHIFTLWGDSKLIWCLANINLISLI